MPQIFICTSPWIGKSQMPYTSLLSQAMCLQEYQLVSPRCNIAPIFIIYTNIKVISKAICHGALYFIYFITFIHVWLHGHMADCKLCEIAQNSAAYVSSKWENVTTLLRQDQNFIGFPNNNTKIMCYVYVTQSPHHLKFWNRTWKTQPSLTKITVLGKNYANKQTWGKIVSYTLECPFRLL